MDDRNRVEQVLQGIAVSPGVAHGEVLVVLNRELEIPSYQVPDDKREEEITRFEQSLLETRQQISAIRAEIEERLGESEARIFDAHQMVLEDRALIEETISEVVESGYNIEFCFHTVAQRYIDAFATIGDEYLAERVTDIQDVSRRLLANLLGRTEDSLRQLVDNRILVADDLSPSDTAGLEKGHVIGLATQLGGRTSHASIMARSIDIPAVVAVKGLLDVVESGDIMVIDGYEGTIIINPSEATLFRYGKIRFARRNIEKLFAEAAEKSAVTQDGVEIGVHLNIDGSESAELIARSGAQGSGLFRTENLFLRADGFPSEETQYVTYKRVVEGFAGRPVTIRTLDLGGDKLLRRHGLQHHEANPFMGMRAIRFCLAHEEVFRDQLKAILRASAYGKVRLMYPMISSLHELREANVILDECRESLRYEGVPFDESMPVGTMVEVPSAAIIADLLAEECDFFSIGTNDLIQYLLAVDRVNDRIAHLYDPSHPAVIRTVGQIVKAGLQAGIPVGVCGEVAAEPHYAALLLGMGVQDLSVAGGSIAELKYFIQRINLAKAKDLATEVLTMTDADEIGKALSAFYEETVGQELRTHL